MAKHKKDEIPEDEIPEAIDDEITIKLKADVKAAQKKLTIRGKLIKFNEMLETIGLGNSAEYKALETSVMNKLLK